MSDIFEQAKGTEPVAEPQQGTVEQNSTTPTPPQVGVEYKGRVWTQEEILNKFQNADSYIDELKAENETLKQKAQTGATLDEVLNRLNTQQTHEEPKPVEDTTPTQPTVDLESVARQAYEKLKQEETQASNLQTSIGKLQEAYGEKAVDILREKANELDMSLDEAKQLASSKPKAFARMFLDGKSTSAVPTSKGTVNTQTLNAQQNSTVKLSQLKGKAYKDEVKRRLATALQNS